MGKRCCWSVFFPLVSFSSVPLGSDADLVAQSAGFLRDSDSVSVSLPNTVLTLLVNNKFLIKMLPGRVLRLWGRVLVVAMNLFVACWRVCQLGKVQFFVVFYPVDDVQIVARCDSVQDELTCKCVAKRGCWVFEEYYTLHKCLLKNCLLWLWRHRHS